MRKIRLFLILLIAVGLVGCAAAKTERILIEWSAILNPMLANPRMIGLDEIRPDLTANLSRTDAWGNELLYRKVRVDLYHLISAGSDGEFGNDDDIISENGRLVQPSKAYSEWPLKQ